MPILIYVYETHLTLGTMDENERVITWRYADWSDLFADYGAQIRRASMVQIRVNPSRRTA